MKKSFFNLLMAVFLILFSLIFFKIEKFVFAKPNELAFEKVSGFKYENINRPFYNVKDYGIFPNTGDNYKAIYNMIKDTVYKTGGTLFFPKGKYTTSYTIFIPENTVLLGEGKETEIYFDETDKWFGTGLANAGSNVTIKNLKVSQKSKGLFKKGSQPGCIGFSDLKKEQAIVGLYVHKAIRGTVRNLVAENLYSDDFYPLQTENSSQFPIHNVLYKNIYAPNGCISIMPGHNIENVYVENVTCDLFRLHNKNNIIYGLKNIIVNKVTTQNLYLNLRYVDDDNVILYNVKQTDKERNNEYIKPDCSAYVSGNIIFNDCKFSSLPTEIRGMVFGKGVQKFYNSEWKYTYKACTHDSLKERIIGCQLFENCKFLKD